MTKRVGLLAILLLSILAPAYSSAADDPCLACHREKTPGIVAFWQESGHGIKGIGCAVCHGADIEANHKRTATVTAESCGGCHEKAVRSHKEGRHSLGLKTGRGCTRNSPEGASGKGCDLCHEKGSTAPITQTECAMFLAQSPEMRRQGCDSCHRVESRCDTCHTKHGTGLEVAGSAETCGTCHMGPDHAQYEMWRTSIHGVLFTQSNSGTGPTAPTCATCHMPYASHNVSQGIATGKPETEREMHRSAMLDICSDCHSRSLAGRSLSDADAIERQSRALLGEAEAIVLGLGRDGLLLPAPGSRPLHPIFGTKLVVGPLMTYEDISGPEAGFFRMMMFHYMSSFKGAFHQNPDYAHWYGNAPLKLALSELKSQELLLRKISLVEKRLENLSRETSAPETDTEASLREVLRALRDQRLKGEITEDEYKRLKSEAMDKALRR